MFTGFFTLIGALIIIGSTATIYTGIFKEDVIVPTISYPNASVNVYNVPFMNFYLQTNLSFEVIAKDFWNDVNKNITCGDLQMSMSYRLSSSDDPSKGIPIPLNCTIKNNSGPRTSVNLTLIVNDTRF